MKDLLDAARQAYEQAYAPYSNFQVGAALRAPSGRIYVGANVENAAYPIGNCAEPSAIAAMIAAGERRITECAVVAAGERLCTPCGGCRQRLAEFAGPDLKIHLGSPDGYRQTLTLGELLPYAFDLEEGDETPMEAKELHDRAADVVRARIPDAAPRVGLILGSGLGGFADGIEAGTAIDYADLPGFPQPSVEGHGGRLVLGTVGGLKVACLQGRVHLYEGVPVQAILPMIRTLRAIGCETLIVTNAAGSLREDVGPGSLVLIEDHINMLGQNPLTGAVRDRFLDLSEAYDKGYRERVQLVAAREQIELATGVYLATPGPSFETPAEIRAFKALGADLVVMSTVPEVIAARHAGLDVIGFSIVTNLAAGMSGNALSHNETLSEAGAAGAKLSRLLTAFCKELA
ncbi:MAG: purine-nucleoside phosphorylase [Pseudomonadota bacterium]